MGSNNGGPQEQTLGLPSSTYCPPGPAGSKENRVVVIGLGYVGLPLARAATLASLDVVGLEISPSIVAGINNGLSHIDDLDDGDISEMISRGFRATLDQAEIARAGVVVICVPTPLSLDGRPDLAAVRGAADAIARHMQPQTLVVLESTTYPGTTDSMLREALEASGLLAGLDFHLAFSPERVDPGNSSWGISNTPKVVGGFTEECGRRAAAFYKAFVEEVVIAKGPREAEMAKLLENTFRHVNIALVNEMVRFCRELQIDLFDAIRCAATKPFGFMPFYPGPGVGGHCIPIDPNYLSYHVRRELGYQFRFVELAQEINAGMPNYVARRIQDSLNEAGRHLRGARVLILGVTYKADISDQRESPANPLAVRLQQLGAVLSFHDPLVQDWDLSTGRLRRVEDLQAAVESADIVVLLQGHTQYKSGAFAHSARLVLDTRGLLAGPNVVRL